MKKELSEQEREQIFFWWFEILHDEERWDIIEDAYFKKEKDK